MWARRSTARATAWEWSRHRSRRASKPVCHGNAARCTWQRCDRGGELLMAEGRDRVGDVADRVGSVASRLGTPQDSCGGVRRRRPPRTRRARRPRDSVWNRFAAQAIRVARTVPSLVGVRARFPPLRPSSGPTAASRLPARGGGSAAPDPPPTARRHSGSRSPASRSSRCRGRARRLRPRAARARRVRAAADLAGKLANGLAQGEPSEVARKRGRAGCAPSLCHFANVPVCWRRRRR